MNARNLLGNLSNRAPAHLASGRNVLTAADSHGNPEAYPASVHRRSLQHAGPGGGQALFILLLRPKPERGGRARRLLPSRTARIKALRAHADAFIMMWDGVDLRKA